MNTTVIIATITTALLLLLTILAFTKRQKTKKKVVLIGPKGAGKTRLLLALSQNKDTKERTIPSIDTSRKPVDNTIFIDTPGTDSLESIEALSGLTPKDTVLYVFKKKEDEKEIKGINSQIIRIYTGDEPYPSKEILHIRTDKEIDQKIIKRILSEIAH